MIGVQAQVFSPAINRSIIAKHGARAADEIAASLVNYVKIALVSRGKVVTAKTLRSIRFEMILNSPSRGEFRRHVTGAKSWLFIEFGRRAGKKMPVQRVAGAGKRGGGVFGAGAGGTVTA